MEEDIKLLLKNKKQVCIYTNIYDTSKFIFGTMCGIDNDFFAINSVTPTGNNDGIIVKLIESVIKIEFDSQYCEKMNKISNCDDTFKIDSENIVFSVLELARDKSFIVSIELNNSGNNDVIGFPFDVNNNVCRVALVDDYGYNDGKSVIKLEDISQVSLLSENEIILKKLWETNNKDETNKD